MHCISIDNGLGVVYGAAGIGNMVSDFMGGAGTGSWDLAFGTAIGCLIGLVFIPMFVFIGKLRRGQNVMFSFKFERTNEGNYEASDRIHSNRLTGVRREGKEWVVKISRCLPNE